jgi:hypothetical protein
VRLKVFIFIAAVIAIVLMFSRSPDTYTDTDYLHSTTHGMGVSLLYDTLNNMGYNVGVSRTPITGLQGKSNVYVFIEPPDYDIMDCREFTQALVWVKFGGRMVFLAHETPERFFELVFDTEGVKREGYTLFYFDRGELIFGKTENITNGRLIESASYGGRLQRLLDEWHSERKFNRILFAEYYHGVYASETFAGRLPTPIRLIAAQIILVSAVAVWHLSRRFGNPVPLYEEVEREENEYVHALTRLYMETERK